ncbi:MAG: type II toxin-antitoxin system PemK/MazF family toxin [Candidatus Paceibacterota bacterium]|jgi:mRNA interferase MazF
MDEIRKTILKIFTDWTKIKVMIHLSEKKVYPKAREIWWVSVGQNIGVEINGKNQNFERPVLILKVFNDDFILVASISSTKRKGKYYHDFKTAENKDNVVVLSQLKSISSKRLIRKIGDMPSEDFINIKNKIRKLI